MEPVVIARLDNIPLGTAVALAVSTDTPSAVAACTHGVRVVRGGVFTCIRCSLYGALWDYRLHCEQCGISLCDPCSRQLSHQGWARRKLGPATHGE